MNNKARDTQIAKTIQEQLGGSMFIMMTGAKQFCLIESGLKFRLPKAKSAKTGKAVNVVTIKLNGLDYYDVTFGYLRGASYTVRNECKDVDCFSLKNVFEQNTSLYTHL